MKLDEQGFLIHLLNEQGGSYNQRGVFVRDIIDFIGINRKRAHYLLSKWAKRKWYEYGVALDMGWLTPEGVTQVEQIPGFRTICDVVMQPSNGDIDCSGQS